MAITGTSHLIHVMLVHRSRSKVAMPERRQDIIPLPSGLVFACSRVASGTASDVQGTAIGKWRATYAGTWRRCTGSHFRAAWKASGDASSNVGKARGPHTCIRAHFVAGLPALSKLAVGLDELVVVYRA